MNRADQLDLPLPKPTIGYTPDISKVRLRLVKLMAEARCDMMLWNDGQVLLYRTVIPGLIAHLPEAERPSWLSGFNAAFETHGLAPLQ